MSNTEYLNIIVQSAFEESAKGMIAKAKPLLLKIYDIIHKDPLVFWDHDEVGKLGKCFVIMNHFDIFDDEDTNIANSHLAYLFISRALENLFGGTLFPENSNDIYELVKDKIILLTEFFDSFTHTVSGFFEKEGKKYSTDERKILYTIANHKITGISYIDFLFLDDFKIDFSKDQFLNDTINHIETTYNFSDKEIAEAKFMHSLLKDYIYSKVKKLEFDF